MFNDVDPPAGTPTGHNMREVAQEYPDSCPTFSVLSASLKTQKSTTPDPLCTQHEVIQLAIHLGAKEHANDFAFGANDGIGRSPLAKVQHQSTLSLAPNL